MQERALARWLLGLVAAILVVVAVAYLRYRFFGWSTFNPDGNGWQTGDVVAWTAATSGDISRLRFRDAVFTVAVGGARHQQNVTPVLAGMAAAYDNSVTLPRNSGTLALDRPLNAFSFVIPGVNDRGTVPDNQTPEWQSATATLTGLVRDL